MGAEPAEVDPATTESMFAALTAGAQDRAESRALDALVGRWASRTEWEPIVGHGVRVIHGRTETDWVYEGRVLRSRTFDEGGAETGTLVLAYDALVGDYIGFAFNVLSTFFVVERGAYRPDSRSWELEAIEPRHDGKPGVRYRRTLQIVGDDRFTARISYPDVPPGTYGPMFITLDRMA